MGSAGAVVSFYASHLCLDVTHIRDDKAQEMLDIFQADKELMRYQQKEHILLTQYLSEFKSRTEVVTRAGGKLGKHPESVKLVVAEQGL